MQSYKVAARSADQVPGTLLSILEPDRICQAESSEIERPKKRRKLHTNVRIRREDERWEDCLTIARVTADLAFAPVVQSKTAVLSPQCHGAREIPIRIKSVNKIGDDEYRYELQRPDYRVHTNFTVQSTMLFEALRIINLAIKIQNPGKRSSCKALCSIKDSANGLPCTRFELKVEIIWRNSKSLTDCRSDSQNTLLASLVPGKGLYKQETWSPRDFYDSVYVPDKDTRAAESLRVDVLQSQLYPFQKRTIRWLLSREGIGLNGNKMTANASTTSYQDLPFGFFQTTDVDGKRCFVSHWLGIITTADGMLREPGSCFYGGILAEEMGLGKTVEMISLICLHKRTTKIIPDRQYDMAEGLHRSSATLIITPPSILQQWKSEIQSHAPSLKVMIYEGIRSKANEDNIEIINRLLSHDVVLSTYHTLASEIHYSGATPEKHLRAERKYERKVSPLVQIDWWRVTLDECQMVESGVSNAAKVGQLIPRRNAWAVSGTPLKKEAKDLFGLLIFLRLEPYILSAAVWARLTTCYKPIFKQLFGAIALRHTKDQVRGEIQLPVQKRVVLTIPFTQIEEQHYLTLYQQMCEECGLTAEGEPLTNTWDPESSTVIEKMRTWLTRLRQTCLHPEVGDRNRRALGRGDGPLRTVSEVLRVMIDQNETATRAEERAYLMSKLRRGQLLEHQEHSQDALDIWLEVLDQAKRLVLDCREEIRVAEAGDLIEVITGNVEHEQVATPQIGLLRLRLRSALEIEHISTFFIANAYYQIKSSESLTITESDRYRELESLEIETYEKAKLLRNEMLGDTQSKADALMNTIINRTKGRKFVEIPSFGSLKYSGGIETHNILARLDELYETLDSQAEKLDEWRKKLMKLLSLPLVDQENTELQGDEYETSTKQQEEIYVYVEGLRALVADRHDALTGQINHLINSEMRTALQQAMDNQGHAPSLMKELLRTRQHLKPPESLGSLRGIITELRALKTTLRAAEEKGSSRATAEIAIVNKALQDLQVDSTKQSKAVTSLEKEVELFKDTMNARLEYYRQLQTISDAVAPFEDNSDGPALQAALAEGAGKEQRLQERIATLKARGRYLMHLQEESISDEEPRICIICQQPIEIGALTPCGHSYCKECLRTWWNAHKTCPTCKKRLSKNDFHQITFKPQELSMQEESPSPKASDLASDNEAVSIYSGINTATLNQIKNIDVEGSFGTKIDTLARHILWIRENDPGAKSIVFSQFRDFLDVLARAFEKFRIDFTSIDKKNGAERFKKDPSVECFFLHAKAHSSGLNLVNATHVFLCEPLINTAIELQAIARVHRIGQHQPTTVWMYLVDETVEKAIYEISVTRRMAHIGRSKVESNVPKLGESDIEAANSLELQDAPLSKLLTKGPGGGELVGKDDLWNCLFRQKPAARPQVSEDAEEVEVQTARFRGASAAEERILM